MGPSRRDLIKGAAAVVMCHGGPSFVKQLSPTVPPSCAPLNLYTPATRWTNKHNNVTQDVERLYRPLNRAASCTRLPAGHEWEAGLVALRAIIAEAERQNKRVRAVGGTWSLSRAATCPDFMIDTSPLNYHAPIAPAHVLPGCPILPKHLFFAQCGTSVMELNTDLQARGLCLRTSGASQGQTICGAFSTGTHGSAIDLGAMQDYVVGMHLLVDGGRSYWIEAASRPIVTDSFCEKLSAERLADDGIFQAALVSFGCFGVIHAVLLEVEDIYSLAVERHFLDWEEIAPLAGTLDFTKTPSSLTQNVRPFHFEVDVNPYSIRKGQKGASVLWMQKGPYAPAPLCAEEDSELSIDVLAVIGGLSTAIPVAVPDLTKLFFHGAFGNLTPCDQGPRGNVFNATTIKGKSMSCEIGVPLERAVQVMDALCQLAEQHPFPGLLCMRYVRASNAPLAFTKFVPVTCTIELPAAGSTRTSAYYARALHRLEAANIPYTLHWGQMNNFDEPGAVRRMWGSGVDDWLAARQRLLTTPAARYRFSSPFTEVCGLGV
jgi:hypothetical protein